MRPSATTGLPRIGHFLLRFMGCCYDWFVRKNVLEVQDNVNQTLKPWHLSMDPLDRLTNDVYDCVTDDALGVSARWGTRELGLLLQRGSAR